MSRHAPLRTSDLRGAVRIAADGLTGLGISKPALALLRNADVYAQLRQCSE